MKRWFRWAAVCLLALALLAACALAETTNATDEAVLNIFTWEGYIDYETVINVSRTAGLSKELELDIVVDETLLAEYNDGRKKALFCTAVNLLPLDDLREILQTLAESTALAALPEKSAHAAALLRQAAAARDIELRLRRKK